MESLIEQLVSSYNQTIGEWKQYLNQQACESLANIQKIVKEINTVQARILYNSEKYAQELKEYKKRTRNLIQEMKNYKG